MNVYGQGEYTAYSEETHRFWLGNYVSDELGVIVETPDSLQVYPFKDLIHEQLSFTEFLPNEKELPCDVCQTSHAEQHTIHQSHPKEQIEFPLLEFESPEPDSLDTNIDYVCELCFSNICEAVQQWVNDNPSQIASRSL